MIRPGQLVGGVLYRKFYHDDDDDYYYYQFAMIA